MKMAYIATDPKTNHCYGICSADPDFIATDGWEDLRQWKSEGAIIELVPKEEAIEKFGTIVAVKEEGENGPN